MHPNYPQHANLDILRVVSSLVFICDLGCKFSYPVASKFVNLSVLNFYYYLLYGRIAFIVLYHIYRSLVQGTLTTKSIKSGFD